MADDTTTQNDGEGAGVSLPAERPDWAPQKFWDADKGELRVEELARGHGELERLIGSRVGDLGLEARRKLAEALPDQLKGTWADDYRTKLATDPEFLAPLEEAWKSKNVPKPPEEYAGPPREDGLQWDVEHPMYQDALALAKKHGLSQEAFADVVAAAAAARADYERPLTEETVVKYLGGEYEGRINAIMNRVKNMAGAHGNALLMAVLGPKGEEKTEQYIPRFLALEELVKAVTPRSLALEPGQGAEAVTQEKLDEMMKDDRYWNDREYRQKVTGLYGKLYNDSL